MPPKKDAPPAHDHFPEVILFLFVLMLLGMAASRFDLSSYQGLWGRFVAYFLAHILPILRVLGAIISILSIGWVASTFRKLRALRKEEEQFYHAQKFKLLADAEPDETNVRWQQIQKHLKSDNAAEWRQAVIEADIMLEELLRASGYHGDTVGDMLKSVEQGDFATLNAAWDAHKVRNRIAHDGDAFVLTDREAKRVIGLYEAVFKEFKVI